MDVYQYEHRRHNAPPAARHEGHQRLIRMQPQQHQEQPHIIPLFDDEEDENRTCRAGAVLSSRCHCHHRMKHNLVSYSCRDRVSPHHIKSNVPSSLGKYDNIMSNKDKEYAYPNKPPQRQIHCSRKKASQRQQDHERSIPHDFHPCHTQYMKDCIELFEQCYSASCQVGASVVKREVIIVNQKLLSFKNRQQRQAQQRQQKRHDEEGHRKRFLLDVNSKTSSTRPKRSSHDDGIKVNIRTELEDEKLEESRDIRMNSTKVEKGNDILYEQDSPMKRRRVSLMSKESDMSQDNSCNEESDKDYDSSDSGSQGNFVEAGLAGIKPSMSAYHLEEERRSIWERADRMKRLSSLFRHMEAIQRNIMNEMKESYHRDYFHSNERSGQNHDDDDIAVTLSS
jgi:hypothetical protein